jgi:outer membrane protein OmpA-like peptidoglycan-associated protein
VRLSASLLASAACTALLAIAVPARAQTTPAPRGALDQLDPAPAGDALFTVASADVPGRLRLSAQVLASYAHDPLVLRHTSGGTQLEWVRDQAQLHLQVSLEALHLLKFDLDMPVTLAVGGVSGGAGTIAVTAPTGASAGDLRAGLRVVVLRQDRFIPAAAVSFDVWAPVGSATAFSGAGVGRVQPGIEIGAEYAHLVWGATVGARLQKASDTSLVGSRIVGGVGVAARFAGLTVGPELRYQIGTGDPGAALVARTSTAGAELLLGARYRLGPVWFGLAGGPGFGSGPGTPSYRLLAAIGGTFDTVPATDPDDGAGRGRGASGSGGAGLPPKVTPPPAPLDTDGDGVPDAEDACPSVIGDATPGAYRRGCPPDRDRDGIPDADDRCPDAPGVESTDPAKNGCPLDSDGDGIPDNLDACPREKGDPSPDPKKNGCPGSVRLEGTQIIILQQVNFETGRDEIKKDSFDLLGQVAAVLLQHPEIARLAVDGHTDDRGGDKPNVNLSERRALAVVKWLTNHGVDARRLEARGYGARRPIADNKTDAGRARNRRVEFLIRRRTDKGEAGWFDGPIEEPGR